MKQHTHAEEDWEHVLVKTYNSSDSESRTIKYQRTHDKGETGEKTKNKPSLNVLKKYGEVIEYKRAFITKISGIIYR